MRRTLYLKLILAYVIFGIFGFIMVSTFASSMTLEHLIREQAEKMYEEATLIANTYATDLYNNQTSLDAVQKQLDALDTYMNATIWIMNPSGRLILDSSTILDINEEKKVENFDPTITLGSYYTTGDFFGYFKEDMLSVYAPITTDFSIKGYVVIHSSMKDLKASKESLLSISYLLLILLFLLSLIILLRPRQHLCCDDFLLCRKVGNGDADGEMDANAAPAFATGDTHPDEGHHDDGQWIEQPLVEFYLGLDHGS